MLTRLEARQHPDLGNSSILAGPVDEIFDRVTGTRLSTGNSIDLLLDAAENYPAWLDAIESAERRVLFESYIIHDDAQGRLFADALISKAREGVEVKVIYDWLGGLGNTPRRFWKRLRAGGVDVRCYNPPNLLDPLGIFCRDHRKTIVVDGETAFVGGLCVGKDWVGDPGRGIPPWRDTGVRLVGPAAAEVERAFADVWRTMGPPLEPLRSAATKQRDGTGGTAVRVVSSIPGSAHIYRIDQILAAGARESMWLTDAYFVGVPSYLRALMDAARDNVDVRILVPQSTDIGIIRDTTRSTYRPLLEAGVRVFEWNGPMMHAKTAVFDGRFSRVGSTNLNIASWFGNYELDVLVECSDFGARMRDMFLSDIARSTEIVIKDTERRRARGRKPKQPRKGSGSMRKATAGALNAATSIGTAIARRAPLGAAESRLLFIAGMVMLVTAALFVIFPRAASIPLVAILLLIAVPTLIKAFQNYRRG